jgi:uncharacterized protein (TIGR02246 family)
LGGGVSISGPAHAQTVTDIRNTIATYAQALDDGRTEDVVATFCPDATVFIPGMDVLSGHEAIREAYSAMKPRRPQRHVVVNTVVSVTDDQTARATSDLLVYVRGASGWTLQIVGRYRDELRMSDMRWRFATRRLEFV